MITRKARLEERLSVNLVVRYGTARDFVKDYAEDLSIGGLFIRGANHLTKGQTVHVELSLPGFGRFKVTAVVAHVIEGEVAEQCNRNPGAGFAITESPPGYTQALRSYLLRLGRRRDHLVMVSDQSISQMLQEAGYQVRPVPLVDLLPNAVTSSTPPVIGIIVPTALASEYLQQAKSIGSPGLIHTLDDTTEIDALFSKLDEKLFGIE